MLTRLKKQSIVALAACLLLLTALACAAAEPEIVEVIKEVPVEVIKEVEVVATPTPAPPAASMEPFVIGAMDSVTGIGESYGTVIVQAKQMAVDDINAAGGVDGRPLELVIEDSRCNAQDAITAYRKLTDADQVKIILGTTCSGAMLGAAPLAEAEGVILFSASATSPDLEDAGDYIFRTAINDAKLGVDAGNAMWVDGVRNLVTINENTDYAEGVVKTSVEHFEELGGSVVAVEKYGSDTVDFRTQLTKLIAENPDAILLAAQSEFTGGTIIKQARELGFTGQIYSEVVSTGTTALEIAGDAATGLKAIIPSPDLETSKGKDFLANFRSRYGYVTLPWFIGSAYDDVQIAAACLAQTGDDQDADGFRDCLYDITWSGAIGDGYSFDEKGEVFGLANAVVQVLPLSERTEENNGYEVLGEAPTP
jgi:branched-chain amino acid transport system substrate-binding protein